MQKWIQVLFVLAFFSLNTSLFAQFQIRVVTNDIALIRINDSVYIHQSWDLDPVYGRYASNGMVLISNKKALLIDSPVTNEQTAQLYNFVRDSLGAQITLFIPGHFHSDCMGGIEFLHQHEVNSLANTLTRDICKAKQLPIPKQVFSDSIQFNFEHIRVGCFYFGPGHSTDNLVVFFPQINVLFGGCLVKAMQSQNLGNLSDANPKQWEVSIKKVQNRFPNTNLIIPGHGAAGGMQLLDHTLMLIQEYNRQ